MSPVAIALKDVDKVDAGTTRVPAAVVQGAPSVHCESVNEFTSVQGGTDGVVDQMTDLSDAQKKDLKSWYSFVKAHPRNPWLALDARLQESLASLRSSEQLAFAKRCYCEMVEPFDFDLYYACVNMALMSDEDVLGYRVYDRHDWEVPGRYRMIAGMEIHCYKKPGALLTDHVERETVYKSGHAATLVEESTYSVLQEIFEAHCKGEENHHWTSHYTTAFSRGCPRCGVKCWRYGPCEECFAECEQWWHISCGASSAEHKLELEAYLMAQRGIGKRVRQKLLESGSLREDRWQILARTTHLAEALKRASIYVDVPYRFRYRLIGQFVERLLELGKDGCRSGREVANRSLEAREPSTNGSSGSSGAVHERGGDALSDLDDGAVTG